MGKDADCCESCRLFGHAEAAPPPPISATPSIRGGQIAIVVLHGGENRTYVPTGPEVVIGRGAQSHLQIADSALSRKQCRILISSDRVDIEDLRSSCGTYVDGRLVQHGELRDGAVIHIGSTILKVVRT